jgi:hypothetical protein
VARVMGEEPVERPNPKSHLGLTFIAAAIIRLNLPETASLSSVSFGGLSITHLDALVYPNSSISEIMP